MSTNIKIGHASISENNTAYGQAGDSTGREVCIRADFSITNMAPTVVLRPKSQTLAEASAQACEAGCINDNIGYSQNGRNTLYTYASAVGYDLAKVTTKCNTDCSAFMTVCAIAGGANINYGTNAPTTTNMRTRFKQSGQYTVLTDLKHLSTTDYLKRGDILVHEGKHTVMVLENGSQYKDEVSEPDTSTSVTLISNIKTYSLKVHITDIKTTSAAVTFKVILHKNSVEKTLTSTTKWNFKLTLKAMSNFKSTTQSFTADTLTLTGLTEGTTYMVQVSALKADGSEAFCSAPKLFTTARKANTVDTEIELGNILADEHLNIIDKVYIKTKDTFKPVLIHKK